ncbi:glutamate receptor 2-like isoform X2 [Actinia tenebrosa]|uniref:Glutamate receptor 2-like isoform X2 n=1 Tax=Actinia tenebrosa TaxID=6105 RepID=A0A6P8HE03_ACTTE|nr:glutamate receptor 2-like isoform X2 [Actinia tenebrosa]
MVEVRKLLSAVIFTLLWFLLLARDSSQQTPKQDIYIVLANGYVSREIMTSLRYAVNKTASGNSSVNFHIRTVSITLGQPDLFEYASSIKNKTTVFIEDNQISQISCIVSSLTRSPLVSLNGRPHELLEVDQCRYVMSVSANSESHSLATRDLVKMNPSWTKIVILYEMEEATHVAQLQLELASEMSRIHLVLMENRVNETDSILLERIWKTIVKTKPQAIIPLVSDAFIKSLLQMQTCSLQNPVTWLIQGKFPSNLTSVGQNIVVAFQLPVTNESETQELKTILKNNGDLPTMTSWMEEGPLLSHDALLLVAKAANDAIHDSRWNASANDSSPYPTNGELLREYILNTSVKGFTGTTKIDSHLEREVEELQIINLQNNMHVKIGNWSKSGNAVLHKPMSINVVAEYCKQPPLRGHTLRITTVEVHPYIIQYKKEDGTVGFRGFCIDILDQLARDLGFKYEINFSPDKAYGALINGEWNGMIRQLIDRKADMAVAALTVTESREKVVDFTVAYQHYTDEMLMSKPAEEDNLFIFVDPLSHAIWFSLAGTVVVVGIITYLLNYFCPYGWKDKNGQGAAAEFSLFNSLWFSLACILQQGAADRPKALSGRIFAGFYWFCILVFVSTYTANLAAFFTAKSAATTINNIQDVINSDYDIGVTFSSALYSYFMTTDYESYQQLWNRMKNRNTFPNTSINGIEWARTKNYIHIADGPVLRYAATQPPCNLRTAPGLSTPKGLAFALHPGSIYTKNMTLSMLRMREKGILDEKQNFWWVTNAVCPKEDTNSLESKKVHLKNMVGVYIVLGGGTVIAFVVLIVEILWKRKAEEKFEKLRKVSLKKTLKTPVMPFNDKDSKTLPRGNGI